MKRLYICGRIAIVVYKWPNGQPMQGEECQSGWKTNGGVLVLYIMKWGIQERRLGVWSHHDGPIIILSTIFPFSSLPRARSSNACAVSSRGKRWVISFSTFFNFPEPRRARAVGYVLAYRKEPWMSTSRRAAVERGSMMFGEPMPTSITLPPEMAA